MKIQKNNPLNLLAFTLFLSAAPSFAAETATEGASPYKSRPHAIGVQASSIAGMGLDYKYAFGDLFHWRVTGMAFPSKNAYYSSVFYNFGTDLQFNIFQLVTGPNTYVRTYIAPAMSYWVEDYSSGYIEKSLHAGATLGFELVIASRFNLHGDLGFGYYGNSFGSGYSTTIAGGLGIGVLF
jgi:hypothetical protein